MVAVWFQNFKKKNKKLVNHFPNLEKLSHSAIKHNKLSPWKNLKYHFLNINTVGTSPRLAEYLPTSLQSTDTEEEDALAFIHTMPSIC